MEVDQPQQTSQRKNVDCAVEKIKGNKENKQKLRTRMGSKLSRGVRVWVATRTPLSWETAIAVSGLEAIERQPSIPIMDSSLRRLFVNSADRLQQWGFRWAKESGFLLPAEEKFILEAVEGLKDAQDRRAIIIVVFIIGWRERQGSVVKMPKIFDTCISNVVWRAIIIGNGGASVHRTRPSAWAWQCGRKEDITTG
ncbi:hypothetical protein R1flu_028524 [Riccia fluitans]|uniref:Uncharacterized protein n=1 Tax=Riccia fluitans TaxID=41844 RepID=A0ABD1XLX2_9MARC